MMTASNKSISVRYAHSFTGCEHRQGEGLCGSSSGTSKIARRYVTCLGRNIGYRAKMFFRKGVIMSRWSKWKKRIEEFICEELKDRVDVHATVYRETHDQRGKVWIELDKRVIFEANTLEWDMEYYTLSDELRRINNCTDYKDEKQARGYYQAYDDAEEILRRKNKMDEFQFYNAMKYYFSSPFKDSLESENTLIRIFCLLDKRLGKRRLEDYKIKRDDCEAIKLLYKVRCQLAGICPKSLELEVEDR